MRAKSIKFVEKNIVENLSDFGLDKDFSNRTQKKKSLQYKRKNDKLEFNKILNFFLLKNEKAIQRLRKNIRHISNKVPVSRIYKVFLKVNNDRPNINKNGQLLLINEQTLIKKIQI